METENHHYAATRTGTGTLHIIVSVDGDDDSRALCGTRAYQVNRPAPLLGERVCIRCRDRSRDIRLATETARASGDHAQ